MFPPGLEPGTFRVLGERDNHYTTETLFTRAITWDINQFFITIFYYSFGLISLENGRDLICCIPSGEILDSEDERIKKIKWRSLNSINHTTLKSLTCSVAAVSNSGRNVATGDQQGTVKLHPYPPHGPKGINVSTYSLELYSL